jgi:hypothetical protein
MATSPNKTGLPEEIFFYCKDCRKLAPVDRIGRRFVYTCSICGTKNVAFGTHRSIGRYFRVKDEEFGPVKKDESTSNTGTNPTVQAIENPEPAQ